MQKRLTITISVETWAAMRRLQERTGETLNAIAVRAITSLIRIEQLKQRREE